MLKTLTVILNFFEDVDDDIRDTNESLLRQLNEYLNEGYTVVASHIDVTTQGVFATIMLHKMPDGIRRFGSENL